MTKTLREQLSQLDADVPVDFVALRRRLIAHALRPNGVERRHLVDLQSTIDQTMALGGTPNNCLRQLGDMLDEHLDALLALTRRLDDEMARHGPGGDG